MNEDADAPQRQIRRIRIGPDGRHSDDDVVVREEPLEIRIGGVPIAVVMRTPGHDEELVRGFVVTERIVDDPRHVTSIRHCSDVPEPEAEDNVMQVVLSEGIEVDLARLRRNIYASSSCGICGKASIEAALATAPPLMDARRVDAAIIAGLPAALRADQAVFERTGGLHAAGLFTVDGDRLVVREDIGRHNAVDKVVGWAQTHPAGKRAAILMVSGRVSYEIVQKALAARIPIIGAVSAPSSLAIDLATSGEVTLVGFVRDGTFNVYANPERIL